MKKLSKLFFPLTLILVLGITALVSLNKDDFKGFTKDQIILNLILSSLEQLHFNTIAMDDKFSKKAYDLYIEQIDGSKRIFTEEDLSRFKPYETLLDDMLNTGNFDFFHFSQKVFNQRLDFIDKYIEEVLSKPISFDNMDTFTVKKSEDATFPKDNNELKKIWYKLLKYNFLQEISEENRRQKSKKELDENYKTLSTEEINKKARKTILKNQKEIINRLKKLDNQDWMSYYLNSMTLVYDPHTTYLPPREKETFDISMSGRLQGIGATLTEKDGYVVVARIVVGSPCWKQGDLAVDDKILLVQEKDSVDVTILEGMRVDQAVTYIRGKKGTEVRLTVEHSDGSRQVIPIVRDIIEIEDTYVKKAIANNVGYIFLPRFYADFSRTGGPSCAKDIKKAILELKAEGVSKIILDLRGNGGGSLSEVVEMAGLFISKGPIVQIKSKNSDIKILKDHDKEIAHDGPLVIMVNGVSASASEILAAAMQDYNRAIVIGTTNTTYGKGTVQRSLDLDTQLNSKYSNFKPLGALNLTLQKFYRVNGQSTQLKGVTPDIIMPSPRSYIDYGEKQQKNVIPWDEIPPSAYTKWDKLNNKKMVVENSYNRMKNNDKFKKIDEYAKWIYKNQEEVTEIPLTFDGYHQWEKDKNKIAESHRQQLDSLTSIPLILTKKDHEKYSNDTIYAAKVDLWFDTLRKDIYLNEAIQVVNNIED